MAPTLNLPVLFRVETKAISGADPVAFKRMCCDPPNATVCEYCGTMIVFPVSRTEVTTCNINVVDFPFDYQNCVISLVIVIFRPYNLLCRGRKIINRVAFLKKIYYQISILSVHLVCGYFSQRGPFGSTSAWQAGG